MATWLMLRHMFRRFFLLLLIALLPLQGIAASFTVTCAVMTDGQTMPGMQPMSHDMAAMSSDMPCHMHDDESAPVASSLDQGCCHHLGVAIPQTFSLPAATHVRGQAYPAIAVSFTDHLPDRLQRPPLARAI